MEAAGLGEGCSQVAGGCLCWTLGRVRNPGVIDTFEFDPRLIPDTPNEKERRHSRLGVDPRGLRVDPRGERVDRPVAELVEVAAAVAVAAAMAKMMLVITITR